MRSHYDGRARVGGDLAAEDRASGGGPVTLSRPRLEAWGERIGSQVATPLVIALRGGLGAGKSVLARSIARGAGVTGAMPSPTFNLVYRYPSTRGVDVWHLDLYRIEDPEEVWELGWREFGSGDEIVLIEWPERAESLLPADRWDVWLDFVGDGAPSNAAAEEQRTVRMKRRGGAPDLPLPDGV